MDGLLSDLKKLIEGLGIPCETGVFSGRAPDAYAVLTPIQDIYSAEGDEVPLDEVQEIRISLFTRGSYIALKRSIELRCIAAGMCISGRRYVGHEDDTGYFHYAIDVEDCYSLRQED